MVNMLLDMTRTTSPTRVISLSVIATLFFAIVQPAWAEDEEEGGPSFTDPTIVTDDSTSTPEGVKDLAKKFEKKPIDDPVYEKWWFWATAVLVAGVVVTAAVIPFQKKAPGCTSATSPTQGYGLGCVGDGR
jgi:hypothetical protein